MTSTARNLSGTLRHIVKSLSAATGMWSALAIAALVLLPFDAHAQPPSNNSRADIAVLAQIVRSANDQLRQAAATGSPGTGAGERLGSNRRTAEGRDAVADGTGARTRSPERFPTGAA